MYLLLTEISEIPKQLFILLYVQVVKGVKSMWLEINMFELVLVAFYFPLITMFSSWKLHIKSGVKGDKVING